ncbi:MAG: hypothetical protein ACMXYE_01990 [Candidatus Woesearchaeota archaeon]
MQTTALEHLTVIEDLHKHYAQIVTDSQSIVPYEDGLSVRRLDCDIGILVRQEIKFREHKGYPHTDSEKQTLSRFFKRHYASALEGIEEQLSRAYSDNSTNDSLEMAQNYVRIAIDNVAEMRDLDSDPERKQTYKKVFEGLEILRAHIQFAIEHKDKYTPLSENYFANARALDNLQFEESARLIDQRKKIMAGYD